MTQESQGAGTRIHSPGAQGVATESAAGDARATPRGGRNSRVRELDGLRGLAIFLVLVWHFAPCMASPTWAPPRSIAARLMQLLSLCWSGVDLFFVLSGFLLGGLLMDQRASPRYFSTFYARRAFRILPPCFLLLGLLQAGVFDSVEHGIRERALGVPWWSHWVFVQNFFMVHAGQYGPFGMTWSLAVEEQFYVLLPMLLRIVPFRHTWVVVLAGVASATPIRLLLAHHLPHGLLGGYVLLPSRWDALLLGVLAAWLLRIPRARAFLATAAGRKVLYGLVVLCAPGLAWLLRHYQLTASWGMSAGGYTLLGITGACVLLLSQTTPEEHWVRSSLRSRWLVFLGMVSYTVYLWHELLIDIAFAAIAHPTHQIDSAASLAAAAIALVACLVLAWISYHAFEQPILKLGHRFRY